MQLTIDTQLSIHDAVAALTPESQITLSAAAQKRISDCRTFLEDFISKAERPIYGINTGFGSLHDRAIPDDQLELLQENLVRSHACGSGEVIDERLARLIMLLKIQGLSLGHSGVKLDTVELLVALFNAGVAPVIYAKGSLGASGDLAPLAHMSLALIGRGELMYEGEVQPSISVLKKLKLRPVTLGAKEGLALLNGTQFMSAHLTLIAVEAERLFDWADLLAALSIEALDGHISPFDPDVHRVRAHKGQVDTAARILKLLSESPSATRAKDHVQDPYCMRCVPQVHGASKDNLRHVAQQAQTEIESVTDNPTIFPAENKIISAGNFHGQPMAIALDLVAIAMAEIGSISERRVYKLNAGMRGLPSFLVNDPGLNSGFMITQYTAAGIVSESKQLCTPASVDTIDSSQGQEDHVSMGANAAVKAKRVLDNLYQVLAIELFNAAQAMELRGLDKTSPAIAQLVRDYREVVPFIEQDEEMYPHFQASIGFIQSRNAFK